MARWGKCDFKELKALDKRLEQLSKVDMDAFCRDAAKDLASRLLTKVKKLTPTNTGALKGNWQVMPVGHRGNHYTVAIVNNYKYASYVEYGHMQKGERFIPGRWEGGRFIYDTNAPEGEGTFLRTRWVPGYKMLTISTQELEHQAPAILEKKLYKFLKGCFDAD